MIYRVLIDQYYWLLDLETRERLEFRQGRLGGAGGGMQMYTGPDGVSMTWGLSDVMFRLGLRTPGINNPRARFYFTERGWRAVGREVAAVAKQRGHVVRVIRRKNPRRSQIVYQDDLQVAILPAADEDEAE